MGIYPGDGAPAYTEVEYRSTPAVGMHHRSETLQRVVKVLKLEKTTEGFVVRGLSVRLCSHEASLAPSSPFQGFNLKVLMASSFHFSRCGSEVAYHGPLVLVAWSSGDVVFWPLVRVPWPPDPVLRDSKERERERERVLLKKKIIARALCPNAPPELVF